MGGGLGPGRSAVLGPPRAAGPDPIAAGRPALPRQNPSFAAIPGLERKPGSGHAGLTLKRFRRGILRGTLAAGLLAKVLDAVMREEAFDDLPGASPETDVRLRATIADLHLKVLGRADPVDSAEVGRTYRLFAGVVADAKTRRGLDPRESYYCRFGREVPDPRYTIRAWRATLTYLLRRQEFLYE